MNGKSQRVSFISDPPGAMISVGGGEFADRTPTVLPLRRAKSYPVIVEKEGYETQTVMVTSSMTHWAQATLGNILFWPFIFVDMIVGSAYEFDQTQVKIVLAKKEETTITSLEFPPPRSTPTPIGVHSDIDVPTYKVKEAPGNYALVIGIEKYAALPDAEFATRDAEAVREHLVALGYPRRNVVYLTGQSATRAGIQKYLDEWLPRNVKPGSTVFFYYSGHGAPDTKTGEAYLVPWDGDAKFLETTAYPVKQLYVALNKLPAKEVFVALDSCFSGAGGRSVLAKGARPLVIQADTGVFPEGKLVLFGAASGDEITSSLEDQGHGMFTYYFLKGLSGMAKNSAGVVTTQGLYQYLKPLVQDEARRQNREQTPVLRGVSHDQVVVRFE